VTAAATRVTRLETTDSTNEEARRRLAAGAETPFWILAERQTAGRGRRGRTWDSAAGNLFLSGAYRLSGAPAELAQLSFVAALAAHDALAGQVLPGALTLKWPNDVLLRGAKVGGILLESGEDARGRWLIAGIGINIASAPAETPYPATCLAEHLAPGLNRPLPETLADAIASGFDSWLGAWRREGFAPVRAAWLARASGLGGPVSVRAGGGETGGVFEDLDDSGALCLRAPDGALMRVTAGEVFFPRAAEGA